MMVCRIKKVNKAEAAAVPIIMPIYTPNVLKASSFGNPSLTYNCMTSRALLA